MNCPKCKTAKLVPEKYEAVSVKLCGQCHGYLVRNPRIAQIKAKREKTDEDFQAELALPTAVDTKQSLFCPSCSRKMVKLRQTIGLQKYELDECGHCKQTWFDAGELARLQLQYENSDQGIEMLGFQERLENMTDAEKTEYEESLQKLRWRSGGHETASALAYLFWWNSRRG